MRYNGQNYNEDKELSNRDMTGWDLSRYDLRDKVIYNSTLANETLNARILPPDHNATFIACNLDNVFVPSTYLLIDCSIRRFKIQNDGEDWLLDAQDKPMIPVNDKLYDRYALSKDPRDIPPQPLREAITVTAWKQEEKSNECPI